MFDDVWCFKYVRVLSYTVVILCYCFFYDWNLVFGDYWDQPACLPGEGIRSRALVLSGGQGENRWRRWRIVGDLHGPWNGRLKHETSWNTGFTSTVQFAMDALDALDAMENRRHPWHGRCEADDEDAAQEAEEEEDEAGFHIPRWPWMVDIVA